MSIPFIQRDNISIYAPYKGDVVYIDINKIYVLLECASKYEQLQKEGYFANNISEFEDTVSMFTLNNINITSPEDINVFSCDDGEYSLFAVIVNE